MGHEKETRIAILFAALVIFSLIVVRPPISPRYSGEAHVSCVNYLRQIEGAKEQYFVETGRTNGAIDRAAVVKYIKGQSEPVCPSGGTYNFGNFGEAPSCSLANCSSADAAIASPPAVNDREGAGRAFGIRPVGSQCTPWRCRPFASRRRWCKPFGDSNSRRCAAR